MSILYISNLLALPIQLHWHHFTYSFALMNLSSCCLAFGDYVEMFSHHARPGLLITKL